MDVVVLRNHQDLNSLEEKAIDEFVSEIEVEKKEAEEAAKQSKGQPSGQ